MFGEEITAISDLRHSVRACSRAILGHCGSMVANDMKNYATNYLAKYAVVKRPYKLHDGGCSLKMRLQRLSILLAL